MTNTSKEDMRNKYPISTFTGATQDELVEFIKQEVNRQVLSVLGEVKSSLLQLKELKENRDDKGTLWGSYDVVDVDDIQSAIKEIEGRFKL